MCLASWSRVRSALVARLRSAARTETPVDRLTNALQSALMLAAGLQRDLQQTARDAAQLVEAASKAASAAHELRPDASKRG